MLMIRFCTTTPQPATSLMHACGMRPVPQRCVLLSNGPALHEPYVVEWVQTELMPGVRANCFCDLAVLDSRLFQWQTRWH